jgi:hypothetical protein
VLAIDTSMSWDELLQLLSQKFQFQATYVALEVGSQNVEIDDVGALHVSEMRAHAYDLHSECFFRFNCATCLLQTLSR